MAARAHQRSSGGTPAAHPPDAVVWPTSTEEVAAIVRAAARTGTPLVPFGAGCGVCGGTLPIRGGIVVDLKRMRSIVELDAHAGAATIEAGLIGEHLEHELNRRGFTLGHFPSSIMCSTFGGWLAARSAGQFSTKYGKIEDMVRRLTFVDGRGDIHTVDAGAAPDVAQWLVGSEGTLGIITRATVTVCPQPETRLYRGWSFPRVAAGCEAIRRLLQRNLRPACVRLYDELDSFLHRGEKDHTRRRARIVGARAVPVVAHADGHERHRRVEEARHRAGADAPRAGQQAGRRRCCPTRSNGCLLIVGFEGERGLTEAEARAAAVELERAGGRDLGEGPGQRWLEHRYAVSFRMSKVFDAGAFVDTMEVATIVGQAARALPRGARGGVAAGVHHGALLPRVRRRLLDLLHVRRARQRRRRRREEVRRHLARGARRGHAEWARPSRTITASACRRRRSCPRSTARRMEIYRALKDVLDPYGDHEPGEDGPVNVDESPFWADRLVHAVGALNVMAQSGRALVRPGAPAELCDIVRIAGEVGARVGVGLGAGNQEGIDLDLSRMCNVLDLDETSLLVSVQSGITVEALERIARRARAHARRRCRAGRGAHARRAAGGAARRPRRRRAPAASSPPAPASRRSCPTAPRSSRASRRARRPGPI